MASVGSRKRKLAEVITVHDNSMTGGERSVSHSLKADTNPTPLPQSMREIRDTMLKIKGTQTDELSMSERIKLISSKEFPRKDEWILSYILQALSKETLSVEDASEVWRCVDSIIRGLKRELVRSLLRKTDLLVLINKFLLAEHDLRSTCGLKSICDLVSFLMEDRNTKKILLSNVERASATLVHTLELTMADHDLQCHLVSLACQLLINNATHRSTDKKLQDAVRISVLQPLLAYLNCHRTSEAIQNMLSQSVFSEIGFGSLSEVFAVVKLQSSITKGKMKLCQMSFDSINHSIKSQNKILSTRNALLGMWLRTVESFQLAELFAIYQTTRTGSLQNRPIASDSNLSSSIQTVITTLLPSEECLDAIVLLLEVDLDVLYPEHESAIWNRIEQRQEKLLLSKWFTVSIEVRALVTFFKSLTALKLDVGLVSDKTFQNTVAEAISKQSPAIQSQIVDIILDSSFNHKDVLLRAAIAGAPENASAIESIHKKHNLFKDRALSRIWSLHVKAPAAMRLAISVPETLETSDDVETWLRARELGSFSTNMEHEIEYSEQCLRIVSQDKTILRAVVERWLKPLICALSNAQAEKFIDILYDASTEDDPIIINSEILEGHILHDKIQQKLCDCDDVKNLKLLALLPARFLHSARRRSIIDRLIKNQDISVDKYKLLHKFAEAGFYPSFESVETYIKFATQCLAQPIDDDILHIRLMGKYNAILTTEMYRDIIQDSTYSRKVRAALIDDRGLFEKSSYLVVDTLLAEAFADLLDSEARSSDVRSPLALIHQLLPMKINQRLSDPNRSFVVGPGQLLEQPIQAWLFRARNCQNGQRQEFLEIAAWTARGTSDLNLLLTSEEFASLNDKDDFHSEDDRWQDSRFQTDVDAVLDCIVMAHDKDVLAEILDSIPGEISATLAIRKLRLLRHLALDERSNKDPSTEWWSSMIPKLCSMNQLIKDGKVSLEIAGCMATILRRRQRAMSLSAIDQIFVFLTQCLVPEQVASQPLYPRISNLFRAVLQHHAHLMRGRYQFVVQIFQGILRNVASFVEPEMSRAAESLVRLFGTFLSSCRALTTTPERFDRAVAKYTPFLLIEYVSLLTDTSKSAKLSAKSKSVIEEGIVYEVLSICGPHEREMMANSLTAAGRALFKKLYEDWNRYGKWTEK